MDDTALFIGLIGAFTGILSLLWNIVNSRRSYIESLRPKINVSFKSEIQEDLINCTIEIENVGSHELFLRTIRIYGYDTSFRNNLFFGSAVYSDNAIIYDNRILNKFLKFDQPLNFENFITYFVSFLNYPEDFVKETITLDTFNEFYQFYQKLEHFADLCKPFQLGLQIRPFFWFQKNVIYAAVKRDIPENILPAAMNIILLDYDVYTKYRVKKDINARPEVKGAKLIWEKHPIWIADNIPQLSEFYYNYNFKSWMFKLKQQNPALAVSPNELGFPDNFSPFEKRFFGFKLPIRNQESYELKLILYITEARPKFLILTKNITRSYSFFSDHK